MDPVDFCCVCGREIAQGFVDGWLESGQSGSDTWVDSFHFASDSDTKSRVFSSPVTMTGFSWAY